MLKKLNRSYVCELRIQGSIRKLFKFWNFLIIKGDVDFGHVNYLQFKVMRVNSFFLCLNYLNIYNIFLYNNANILFFSFFNLKVINKFFSLKYFKIFLNIREVLFIFLFNVYFIFFLFFKMFYMVFFIFKQVK